MLCYSIEFHLSIFFNFWVDDKIDIQLEKSDIENYLVNIRYSTLMIFDDNIIKAELNNFRYPIFLVQYLFIIIMFFLTDQFP